MYENLGELIEEAKRGYRSLSVFKPRRITGFSSRSADPQWDDGKLAAMRRFIDQKSLFDDDSWRRSFSVVQKIPFSFRYTFEDNSGRMSTESQQLDLF